MPDVACDTVLDRCSVTYLQLRNTLVVNSVALSIFAIASVPPSGSRGLAATVLAATIFQIVGAFSRPPRGQDTPSSE